MIKTKISLEQQNKLNDNSSEHSFKCCYIIKFIEEIYYTIIVESQRQHYMELQSFIPKSNPIMKLFNEDTIDFVSELKVNINKIKILNTLKIDYNNAKNELYQILICILNVLNKRKKQLYALEITLKVSDSASFSKKNKKLINDIIKLINDISTIFFHPIAIDVNAELRQVYDSSKSISTLLKSIDTHLVLTSKIVKHELSDTYSTYIEELRIKLPVVLLNGTIREANLQIIVNETHAVFKLIKKNISSKNSGIINQIIKDISKLKIELTRWKVSTLKYYSTIATKHGVSFLLDSIATFTPLAPVLCTVMSNATTSLTRAITGGVESIVLPVEIAQGTAYGALLDKATSIVENSVKDHIHTLKAKIPHTIYDSKAHKVSVDSSYLWENDAQLSILEWIKHNKLETSLKVINFIASVIASSLAATGILAPVSVVILLMSIGSMNLLTTQSIKGYETRQLTQSENETFNRALDYLNKFKIKFTDLDSSFSSAFVSQRLFAPPKYEKETIKHLDFLQRSRLNQ